MDIYKNAGKATLLLEDGTQFNGLAVGAKKEAVGQLVFNTGVIGYQQLLTDPANENNILVHTFPMIGNYGVNGEDNLTENCTAKAVVMREWCDTPSNYRCTGRFDAWLEEKGIPGIFGIDTRALTKYLRDNGSKQALLTFEEVTEENKEQFLAKIKEAPAVVPYWKNNKEVRVWGEGKNVTVYDVGLRQDIVDALTARGCKVTAVPACFTAEQIMETKPQALLVCGGYANMEDLKEELATVEALTKTGIPMLGIDLGHQLMALAAGSVCVKLSAGHRGANCPVSELATGRTFITNQNHGAVAQEVDPAKAEVIYVNANDKTCEGLRYLTYPGMSVQFIPEAELGRKNFDKVYESFFAMAFNK